MPFYSFSQNNSGGDWVGTWHNIIIEAATAQAANDKAERETDIYFNGCDNGRDCSCCGDRWYAQWNDSDGDDVPKWYSVELDANLTEAQILEENPDAATMMWHEVNILVLYADGHRKEWRFTRAHFDKAKADKLAATDFLYGFRVVGGAAPGVSRVLKCYKPDGPRVQFGRLAHWYAADGNNSILGEGWVEDDNPYSKMLTYGGRVRKDVEAKQKEVKKTLADANAAATKAAFDVLDTQVFEPGLLDLLMKLYE